MSVASASHATHRRQQRAQSALRQSSTRSSAGKSTGTVTKNGISPSLRFLNWLGRGLGLDISVRGHGLKTRVNITRRRRQASTHSLTGQMPLAKVSGQRLDDMRLELRRLLRQHPNTKTLLRHLAYVERKLRRVGLAEVDALPLDVLSKALAQLETLVVNWSTPGLAELRSRLAVLVKYKRLAAQQPGQSVQLTEFDAAQRADVSEVSHSLYDEMERSWTGAAPPAVRAVKETPASR